MTCQKVKESQSQKGDDVMSMSNEIAKMILEMLSDDGNDAAVA